MATSGSGVAVSSGSTLLIYDAIGTVIASLAKPQSRTISAPVTAADGRIFFADSTRVYAVDGTGQEVWQKALGTDQSGGMAAPLPPVLSSTGRLYVSALDGMLWTFRGEDGQVLANVPLGFLQESPRWIDAGVASVLFVDRSGISAAGPGVASEGIVEPDTGRWVGEIVVGAGMYHPGAFVGYDIGVVSAAYLDTTTETTETDVFDKCGNFRWRVPGDHAVPLAITFNDDLIVMDRSPIGGGKYTFALRRFSRDGALVAGPVAVPDTFCGRSFVGADDTFYYTGGASDGYRLRAFDSKLMQLWAVPFPHCPDAAVLNPDGKIFTARGPGAQFAAVQTTSPGPAPVSWGQTARDSHGSRWLSP